MLAVMNSFQGNIRLTWRINMAISCIVHNGIVYLWWGIPAKHYKETHQTLKQTRFLSNKKEF